MADDDALRFAFGARDIPPALAMTIVNYPRFRMVPHLNASYAAPPPPAGSALVTDTPDRLLLPWKAGVELVTPGGATQQQSGIYPGVCPMSFTARYDNLGGLYYGTEDATGGVKQWLATTVANEVVAMDLWHHLPLAANASLTYNVSLTTFGSGGWRAAADIYRRWALQQWWTKTPLAARKDIPAFLLNGTGIVIVSINSETGFNPGAFGPRLERLPAYVAAFRQHAGLNHLTVIPYGWYAWPRRGSRAAAAVLRLPRPAGRRASLPARSSLAPLWLRLALFFF